MSRAAPLIAPLCALMLSGCLARTAIDVVTLPVKVASKTVDAVTTSQSEADQKRGRAIRQREERLGKLERQHAKLAARCDRGDSDACGEAAQVAEEIDELLPTIPAER